jgi:membrane protein DedA with SNARE-associated domain
MQRIFNEYKELFLIFLMATFFIWIFKFGWGYFNLPSASELVQLVIHLFKTYGLIIVFISATIESILLLGGYFPGTMIIFLSLSLAGGDFKQTAATVLTATAGMLLGYSIDYFLGKRGVSKLIHKLGLGREVQKLEVEIKKQGVWAGFFLYILPGFGALISTTFGILKYDFQKFFGFMILTVLTWNSVWGLTGYVFGDEVVKVIESGYFGFIILGIFMIYFVASGKYTDFKRALEQV